MFRPVASADKGAYGRSWMQARGGRRGESSGRKDEEDGGRKRQEGHRRPAADGGEEIESGGKSERGRGVGLWLDARCSPPRSASASPLHARSRSHPGFISPEQMPPSAQCPKSFLRTVSFAFWLNVLHPRRRRHPSHQTSRPILPSGLVPARPRASSPSSLPPSSSFPLTVVCDLNSVSAAALSAAP